MKTGWRKPGLDSSHCSKRMLLSKRMFLTKHGCAQPPPLQNSIREKTSSGLFSNLKRCKKQRRKRLNCTTRRSFTCAGCRRIAPVAQECDWECRREQESFTTAVH